MAIGPVTADTNVGTIHILGFFTILPIWSMLVPRPCDIMPFQPFSRKLSTANPTGEDPYLNSVMGTQTVLGMQGNDSKYLKLHSCAKHYAVHSGPEPLRHQFDVTVSGRDLWETYLPAFKSLVQDGNVQEVMCAYHRYEGDPCCASDRLLQDILRSALRIPRWQAVRAEAEPDGR